MSTAEKQAQITSTEQGLVMGRDKLGVLLFLCITFSAKTVVERRFKR